MLGFGVNLAGQGHAGKARRALAQGGFPGRQRVHPLVVAIALAGEEGQAFGQHAGMFQQIILIAHGLERRRLRLRVEAGEMVLHLGVEARQVSADGGRQRRFGEELRPRLLARAGDQTVAQEMLPVKERGVAQPGIGFGLKPLIAGEIDTQIGQHLLGGEAVGEGRFNAHRAAIGKDGAAAVVELVALGVTAEIVVIIKDQDLAIIAQCLPVEMGRRQAGNAAAHDHQIIMFAAVIRRNRAAKTAVAGHVRGFETAGILPAQAGFQRGIVGRFGRPCRQG